MRIFRLYKSDKGLGFIERIFADQPIKIVASQSREKHKPATAPANIKAHHQICLHTHGSGTYGNKYRMRENKTKPTHYRQR
jgi:hypothetical protein